MLILNHFIKPLKVVFVSNKESITQTLPDDFLVLDSSLDSKDELALAKFCFEHNVPYACIARSIVQSLILVGLGVKFFITLDKQMAKELQKLAEHYLFDSKILFAIKDEKTIEEVAKMGIDGVIFLEALDG